MADRADVVVIGAGVGGLAVAIRLAAGGRRVLVLERNEISGGKLATVRHGGATFDVGPSLLTLPHLFDELLRSAGTTLADELDLVRLDPQLRYHWPDGSTLVVPDDPADTAEAFEAFCRAGAAWRRFDAHGRRVWEVAERTFLAGPIDGPLAALARMRSPRDLGAIDPLRTLRRCAASFFDDRRLVQWAGRYATYSGSSPFRAPATLSCIPHVESRFGCWYPRGGLDAIRAALQRVAIRAGVEVRTSSEVTQIATSGDRVSGVETADGGRVDGTTVVANADAEHVYRDLLPDARALRRLRRAPRSTSALVVMATVRGSTPGVGHHNVWFSTDECTEFGDLAAGRMAADPTIYGCVSCKTDPTQAMAGMENWFLLVNAPAGVRLDGPSEARRVFDVLTARGIDLGPRVEWHDAITPLQLAARTRAPAGAIYGTSSDGRRAAFLRPGNRGARLGLYLVGGSSHPGGGLPMVVTSARIVADLIATERS